MNHIQQERLSIPGAAAQLVQNHERIDSGVFENRRSFVKLNHERGPTSNDIVDGTNTSEDAV